MLTKLWLIILKILILILIYRGKVLGLLELLLLKIRYFTLRLIKIIYLSYKTL
jgi:hypothetical protein